MRPVLDGLVRPDSTILDIGGNDGSVSTGGTARPIVLDVDEVGLKQAKALGVAGVMASATQIPMASASVDLALCCDVLPCMAPEDAPRAYAEIARVLDPDGRLVVTEVDEGYTLPFVDNEAVFRRWRARTGGVSYAQLVTLLEGAGLTVLDHRMFYGVITRFAYTVFFVWARPRRGYRLKQRAWRAIVATERWWCPDPRAHLVVARVGR